MTDTIKYRLLLDANDDGETFDDWENAAQAAIQKGVGRWKTVNEFELDWPATIKAVRPE